MIEVSELIEVLTLLFITASATLMILDRFNHPALPAYILAGLILGPLIPEEDLINLSQIGIAFLVFIFGVKLDLTRIKSVARDSQFIATVQVIVIGLLSLAAGLLLNLSLIEAIYLSVFASLSSSLVGLQLIEEEIQINLIHGRLAESIQLIQDIIALVILIGLTAVTTGGNVVTQFTYGIGLMIAAVIIRNVIFDYIGKMIENSRELFMITSIAFLAGFIGIATSLNLSIAVGAFAAGLSVSKFPHNMEILDTTGSLKDFFSALFFISLGALVTFPGLQTLAIAIVLIMLVGLAKPIVTVLGLMSQGFDDRTAHLTGFSLDQISEFGLIIGISGYLSGTISASLFNALIIAATVTMITSAYTSRHEDFLYNFIRHFKFIPSRRNIPKSDDLGEMENHIIIIGYDTQGKRIVEALQSEDVEYVVMENDPEKIEDLREKDEPYIYGHVMDQYPWSEANFKEAQAIISTVPVMKVSEHMLKLDTDADMIMRSETIEGASKLLDKGAIYVNVPEILSSEMLADHIEGVIQDENYREELRRRNLLEIRKFLQSEEG